MPLTVEMRAFTQSDEELRAVSVGTLVGHTKETLGIEWPSEIFVGKGTTVYGFAASTITFGKVWEGW